MSYLYYLVVFLVSLVVFFAAGFLITNICKILYKYLVPLKKREELSISIKRREDKERMYGRTWEPYFEPFHDFTNDSAYAGLKGNIY